MDSARWEKIQSVFHQAVELPESGRDAFLAAACGDDAEELAEVRAMLHEDGRDTSLLDRGVQDVAVQMIGASGAVVAEQEFGPYRLKRVLGEGGMGVVWLAVRQDAGNQVAIKFLPHAGLSPARRERFTREIKTLAKLKHPFIARLYDAGTLADGTPWFVMEYVEGARFTDYCRERGLGVEARLRLFRSVCEAVQYAHGQEIIHRDLKPSNILVDETGAPRLLDFGIARELRGFEDPADQTQPGLRFMSPDYAAPEWIRDDDVGFYTDVYSLGVILYEILAGQLPFERSKASAEARSAADPVAPSVTARRTGQATAGSLSKSAWSDLDVLCLKAMHKDARQRYSSVEALARDVDHYLKREPLEARPDSAGYRVGKFASRNWRALAAASAMLILVIGLIAFYTFRLTQARNRATREAAIATAMNRFLADDLLAQSDPFKSGNASQTLADAITQASPNIDVQFKDEPLVAARLHQTIAVALSKRSDFAQARSEYARAIELFVQAGGTQSQGAILIRLRRAAMEAGSGEPGSLDLARSMLKDAEGEISKIPRPQEDLTTWVLTTRGIISIVENDGVSAQKSLAEAVRRAQVSPSFDQSTVWKLKQMLAFSYIRSNEGAKAEAAYRDLLDSVVKADGAESPKALQVRLSLGQALMTQGKYADALKEANLAYPAIVRRLGADSETALALLENRAADEGSLHLWDDAIRDDLAVREIALKKVGHVSMPAVGSLSDAGLSQCRAGRYPEGEANTRRARNESRQAFPKEAGIIGGVSYALAMCLIGTNKLEEAAKLLADIDVNATARASGDPNVAASVALAKGQIAMRRGDYAAADRYAQQAAPAFDRPDADSIDKQALQEIISEVRTKNYPPVAR